MTTKEFDVLFAKFSDEKFSSELNREAKQLLAVAEKSEQFRAVISSFAISALQSITIGGLLPKPLAMMALVIMLLGARHTGAALGVVAEKEAEMIPLSEEEMEKLRKEIDQI